MDPDTYNSTQHQKKKKKKKKTETEEEDEDDDTLMDTASAFNDRSFGNAPAPKAKTPSSSPKSPKRNRSPKSPDNKTSPKAVSPKAASPKAVSPKAASPKAVSPKAASPKAVSPKAASPKAVSPKAVSPKAASPKAMSPKAASPKAVSPPTKTKSIPSEAIEVLGEEPHAVESLIQEAFGASEHVPSEIEASEDEATDVAGVLSEVADKIEILKQASVETNAENQESPEKSRDESELEEQEQEGGTSAYETEEEHADKEPDKIDSRGKDEEKEEQKEVERNIERYQAAVEGREIVKKEIQETTEVVQHDRKDRVRKCVQRKCYELNTRVRSPREVMTVNLKEVCCQSKKTKGHQRDRREYEIWRAEDELRHIDYEDPCSGSKSLKHRDRGYRIYLQRKKHAREEEEDDDDGDTDDTCEEWRQIESRKTKSPHEAVLSRKTSSSRSRERRDPCDCKELLKQTNRCYSMQDSVRRKYANNEPQESDSEICEDDYRESSKSRSPEVASPGKRVDASLRKREKPPRERYYERAEYAERVRQKKNTPAGCSDSDSDSGSTTEHHLPKYKRIHSSSSYASSLNDRYSSAGDECSQIKQPSEFRFKYRLDSPRCNPNEKDRHRREWCKEEEADTGGKMFEKRCVCPRDMIYCSSGRSDCSSVEVRITNSCSSCDKDKMQRYRDKRETTGNRTNEEIVNEGEDDEYLDARSRKVSSDEKRHVSQRRRKDCEEDIPRVDTLKGKRKTRKNECNSFERPDKIYGRSKSSLGYRGERRRQSAERTARNTSESRAHSRDRCLENVTVTYTDGGYPRKNPDSDHRNSYRVNRVPSSDNEIEGNTRHFTTSPCKSSSPSSTRYPQNPKLSHTLESFCDDDLDISFEEAYTSSSVVRTSNNDLKGDIRHGTSRNDRRSSKGTEQEEEEDGARDNETAVHSSSPSLSDESNHEGEESDCHRTVSISVRSRPSNSVRDYSHTISDNDSLQDTQSRCCSSDSEYSSDMSIPEQKRNGENTQDGASRNPETVQRVKSADKGCDENCVSSRSRLKGSIKIRGNKGQRCDSPESKNMTLCFSKGKLKVTSSPNAESTNACSECESYCSENMSADSDCDKLNRYKRYSHEDARSRTLQKEMPCSKFNISEWWKKDRKHLDSCSPKAHNKCYNSYAPRTPSPGDCTSPKSEYLQKMMYSEHMQRVHGHIPKDKSQLKSNEMRNCLRSMVDSNKIVDRDKYNIAYRSRSNSAKRSINLNNENSDIDTFRQVVTPEKVKVVNKMKQVSLHRQESSDVGDDQERSSGNFSRGKVLHKSKSPPLRLRPVDGAFEHVSSFEEYFLPEDCDGTPIPSPRKYDMFVPEEDFYEDDESAQRALIRLSSYASWARNKNASSSVRKDLNSSSPGGDNIYSASDYHRGHVDTVKRVGQNMFSSPEARESITSEVTSSRSDSTILEGGDHGSLIQKVKSMTSLQAVGSLDETFRQIRENSMRALMYASTMTDWATLSLLICSRFSKHEKEKCERTRGTRPLYSRRSHSLDQIKVSSATSNDQTVTKEFRKSCNNNSFTRINQGNVRHKSCDYKKTRNDSMFNEVEENHHEAKPNTSVVAHAHLPSCLWSKQSKWEALKIKKKNYDFEQKDDSVSTGRNDHSERDYLRIVTDDSLKKKTFTRKQNRISLPICNALPKNLAEQDSVCLASRQINNFPHVGQMMEARPSVHHNQYLQRNKNEEAAYDEVSNKICCFCKKKNFSSAMRSEANNWADETFRIFYENLSSNWMFSRNKRPVQFMQMKEKEMTKGITSSNDNDQTSTDAVENSAPSTTHRSWFQPPKMNKNQASTSEVISDHKSVFQKLKESISHEINVLGTAIGETIKSETSSDKGHALNDRESSVDVEVSPYSYLEGESVSETSTVEFYDANASKSPEDEYFEHVMYPALKRPRKRKKGTGARENAVGDKRDKTSLLKDQPSSRVYFRRAPRDARRPKCRNKSTKKSKNILKGRKRTKPKSNISYLEETPNIEDPGCVSEFKENIHEGFGFSGISRIAKSLNFISNDFPWDFDKGLCQADDETMNFEEGDLANELTSSEESDKGIFDDECAITDTDQQTQQFDKKNTAKNITNDDKSSSDETSSTIDLKNLVNSLKTMEHPPTVYNQQALATETNLSCKDTACDCEETVNNQNMASHVMELFYPDVFHTDEETLKEDGDGFRGSEEEFEETATITESTGGNLLTTIKEESGDLGDSAAKKTVSSASTASLASLSKSNADQTNPSSVCRCQESSIDPEGRKRDELTCSEFTSTRECETCQESETFRQTGSPNLVDKLIDSEGLQCKWEKTNNLFLSLSDTVLLPKEKISYLKQKKCTNSKLLFQMVDHDGNTKTNSNPPLTRPHAHKPFDPLSLQASEDFTCTTFKRTSNSSYKPERKVRPFKSWFLREDLNSHLPPPFTATSQTAWNDGCLYPYSCETNNSHWKMPYTNTYKNYILLSPVSNDTSSSNSNNRYVSALDGILMSSNSKSCYQERDFGTAAHHQYYLRTMTPAPPLTCSLNFNYFKEDYKSDFLRTESERENNFLKRRDSRWDSYAFSKSTDSKRVRKLFSMEDINFMRLQRDFLESNWNESANNTSGGSGSDVSSDTSETDENSPNVECEGKCSCRPFHVSASCVPHGSELPQPGCSKTAFNPRSWDIKHTRNSSCERKSYVDDIIDVDLDAFAGSQFCAPKDVSQSNATGLGVATFAKRNTNSSGNTFGRHMCADLQNDRRQIERYETKITGKDSGEIKDKEFCSTTSKICHQSSDPGPIRHFDLGRMDTCDENCLFEHHDAPLFQPGAKGESCSMSATSNEMRPEISSFLEMNRDPWVPCDCDSSRKCLAVKKGCCCYQDAVFGADSHFQEQPKCEENRIYPMNHSYFGQGDNCREKPFIHWYVDDDVGGNCFGGNIEQFRSIPVSFKTFDDEDMKQTVDENIWAISSNGVLMHGEETSESESDSFPSNVDDDEFEEDGNKSRKQDIRRSLDDTDSDDDKLDDKEERNEEDSHSNNSEESMFGDPMENMLIDQDNKINTCRNGDSDMKTFKSCSEKHLNFTQNKITENRKNYDFGSNVLHTKNAISVADKSNAKTQPISPAPSKTRKFSVDQLSVPTVEKERVRFACDENGEWAEIGRGSYGCVYLGLLDGSVEVAIKDFYESNSYDMVIHEARMLLFLQDTKIIPRFYGLRRRFDASKNPPEFCIIMEYFGDGRTLFNVMSDKISLCCEEWLDVLGQLVAGLRLIHCKDVLINDLKADNILIDLNSARKTIRYIDVGMATYRHGLTFQLPQEQMGKYNFLAPEVREGARTSTKSDIYSLGYLLEQMLQMAGCSLTGLSRLVSSCMEERPEARPTADEIVGQVHRFIASRTVASKWSGQKCVVAIKSV